MQVRDDILLDLTQRARHLDNCIQLVDINEAVAVRARHLRVYLGDHAMRKLRGCQRGIHSDAEAAISVRIRGRYLNKCHIDPHFAAFEQGLNFAEKNGRVIGTALLYGFTDISSNEQCVVTEALRHFGSAIR